MSTPIIHVVAGAGHQQQVFVQDGDQWVELSPLVMNVNFDMDPGDVPRLTLELRGDRVEVHQRSWAPPPPPLEAEPPPPPLPPRTGPPKQAPPVLPAYGDEDP